MNTHDKKFHATDEENDDILIGRVLTRREALLLMGGSGLAFLAGCGGSNSGGVVVPMNVALQLQSEIAVQILSHRQSRSIQT